MSSDATRKAILEATDRLIAGNALRSDGKLTVKSLAVEAAVARHQLTEVHTDLKDAFYARVRSADQPPAALVAEHTKRVEAEESAEQWRARARAAEARVDELIRALHVVAVVEQRQSRRGQRLTVVPD